MDNIQIHRETGCKAMEGSLKSAKEAAATSPMANDAIDQVTNTSRQAEADKRPKQLGNANDISDAAPTAPAPKLKVERYTVVVNYPKYEDEYDDGNRTETRFRIITEEGEIVDDAQGYGYRSAQGAHKAMWYKFKGGRQKMNRDEKTRKWLFKSDPIFARRYSRLCEDSNFKYHKYMGIGYTIKDWHDDLKALLEEFKIDTKYFKLLV